MKTFRSKRAPAPCLGRRPSWLFLELHFLLETWCRADTWHLHVSNSSVRHLDVLQSCSNTKPLFVSSGKKHKLSDLSAHLQTWTSDVSFWLVTGGAPAGLVQGAVLRWWPEGAPSACDVFHVLYGDSWDGTLPGPPLVQQHCRAALATAHFLTVGAVSGHCCCTAPNYSRYCTSQFLRHVLFSCSPVSCRKQVFAFWGVFQLLPCRAKSQVQSMMCWTSLGAIRLSEFRCQHEQKFLVFKRELL